MGGVQSWPNRYRPEAITLIKAVTSGKAQSCQTLSSPLNPLLSRPRTILCPSPPWPCSQVSVKKLGSNIMRNKGLPDPGLLVLLKGENLSGTYEYQRQRNYHQDSMFPILETWFSQEHQCQTDGAATQIKDSVTSFPAGLMAVTTNTFPWPAMGVF